MRYYIFLFLLFYALIAVAQPTYIISRPYPTFPSMISGQWRGAPLCPTPDSYDAIQATLRGLQAIK